MIHFVSVDVPPDDDPLQFESTGTSHPAGLRLKNAKFPPFNVSLSYQKVHVWPFGMVPFGGIAHVPGARRLLRTIGIGLLLPSPQLAVAVVVTGDSWWNPITGAKYSACSLVYRTITCPYCEGIEQPPGGG